MIRKHGFAILRWHKNDWRTVCGLTDGFSWSPKMIIFDKNGKFFRLTKNTVSLRWFNPIVRISSGYFLVDCTQALHTWCKRMSQRIAEECRNHNLESHQITSILPIFHSTEERNAIKAEHAMWYLLHCWYGDGAGVVFDVRSGDGAGGGSGFLLDLFDVGLGEGASEGSVEGAGEGAGDGYGDGAGKKEDVSVFSIQPIALSFTWNTERTVIYTRKKEEETAYWHQHRHHQ